MKRMRMNIENDLTFGEGCNEYLRNCETRNLREGTLKHYRESMKQLYIQHYNKHLTNLKVRYLF